MRDDFFYKGKVVYKFDGTKILKEDLRHLYVIDQLSIKTIAFVLDVKEIEVAYHMLEYKMGHRVADSYVFIKLSKHIKKNKEDHFEEQRKKHNEKIDKDLELRRREIESKNNYTNPSKDTVLIKDKRFVDVEAVKAYKEKINTELMVDNIRNSNKKRSIKYTSVRSVDLSAMRLHRGLDMMQFSTKAGIPYKQVTYYEKTKYVSVPKEISELYKRVLSISNKELKHIRECLSGERKDMFEEENRYIPDAVRKYVYDRDGGKCRECEREEYLHYHHKERYSVGGKHQAKNLMLLCVGCHALEHYGEKSFHLLKSKAEKLGVFLNVS